jgi:hypothetical protein
MGSLIGGFVGFSFAGPIGVSIDLEQKCQV